MLSYVHLTRFVRTPRLCPAGTADSVPGAAEASCVPCPKGTYAGVGSVTCVTCGSVDGTLDLRGTHDHDGNASTPCANCSAGYAASGLGQQKSVEWPYGAQVCVQCAAGFFDGGVVPCPRAIPPATSYHD